MKILVKFNFGYVLMYVYFGLILLYVGLVNIRILVFVDV